MNRLGMFAIKLLLCIVFYLPVLCVASFYEHDPSFQIFISIIYWGGLIVMMGTFRLIEFLDERFDLDDEDSSDDEFTEIILALTCPLMFVFVAFVRGLNELDDKHKKMNGGKKL